MIGIITKILLVRVRRGIDFRIFVEQSLVVFIFGKASKVSNLVLDLGLNSIVLTANSHSFSRLSNTTSMVVFKSFCCLALLLEVTSLAFSGDSMRERSTLIHSLSECWICELLLLSMLAFSLVALLTHETSLGLSVSILATQMWHLTVWTGAAGTWRADVHDDRGRSFLLDLVAPSLLVDLNLRLSIGCNCTSFLILSPSESGSIFDLYVRRLGFIIAKFKTATVVIVTASVSIDFRLGWRSLVSHWDIALSMYMGSHR